MQHISEPGETVHDLFNEESWEINFEDDCEPMDQDVCSFNDNEKATKTPNTIHYVETQTNQTTGSPETTDAGVRTEVFDYMFSATKVQPFTEDYFRDSEDKVRFYTGLPEFNVLKHVVDFVSPHVTRRSKTLSPFQECVLVLMKLRLNVPSQDLAYRFDISLPTVSRIFSSWIVVLDTKLSNLIYWPESEELWHTMPVCFQYSFGNKTTVIIDCFEVFIERPSNLQARAQTYSHYKHHNTVKILIGITPQGSISFVSKAWGGRTSDKFLTERCGMLKLLNPGDLVMT